MRTDIPVHKAPLYLCKIENTAYFRRLIFWAFRKWILNEDAYKLTVRFTGPRPRGTSSYSTRKENATAGRYYLDRRPDPAASLRRRNIRLVSNQLDNAMQRPYR